MDLRARRATDEIPGAWGLWFDLWAQAFRHDEVKAGRIELDPRWRHMSSTRCECAEVGNSRDVDAEMFALEFAALLDGLSIQVALEDPEVDSDGRLRIAMRFAERDLDLPRRECADRSRRKDADAPARDPRRPGR